MLLNFVYMQAMLLSTAVHQAQALTQDMADTMVDISQAMLSQAMLSQATASQVTDSQVMDMATLHTGAVAPLMATTAAWVQAQHWLWALWVVQLWVWQAASCWERCSTKLLNDAHRMILWTFLLLPARMRRCVIRTSCV